MIFKITDKNIININRFVYHAKLITLILKFNLITFQ